MTTCTVCFDLLDKDLSVTNCGHVFHFHCLSRWFQRKMDCPVCKTKLTHKRVRKLHLAPLDIAKDIMTDPDRLEDLTEEQREALKPAPAAGGGGAGMCPLEKKRIGLKVETLQKRLTQAEAAGTQLFEQNTRLKDDKQQAYEQVQKYKRKMHEKDQELERADVKVYKKNEELLRKREELRIVREEYASLANQEDIFQYLQDLKDGKECEEIEMALLNKGPEQREEYLKTQLTFFKVEYNATANGVAQERERAQQEMGRKTEQLQQLAEQLKEQREATHEMRKKAKQSLKRMRELESEIERLNLQAQLGSVSVAGGSDRRLSMASAASGVTTATGTSAGTEHSTPALFKAQAASQPVAQARSKSGTSSLFAAMGRMESKAKGLRAGGFGSGSFRKGGGSFGRSSKLVRGGDGRGGSATFVNSFNKKRKPAGRNAFAVPSKRRKMGKTIFGK